jgi:hypothetical protein
MPNGKLTVNSWASSPAGADRRIADVAQRQSFQSFDVGGREDVADEPSPFFTWKRSPS